ncbi:GAF domain-containing protein [Roseomonas hellenica]|uniref:GAF domain-containing protein n=1 Tax=Plastoroseomonas hellenica TaxID=2687306 RepID=A0ABS5F731_9PROT|nr:GAF domain-containing protein [Plastoroseomonas hellenica]
MADEALLDLASDPAGRRRRARRRAMRVGVPIAGVVLIAAAILGIALYAHEANRRGALALSTDLLRTLESRVAEEVHAFLGPVDRAARIGRDLAAAPIATAEGRGIFERYAAAMLRVLPQLALAGLGDAEGNYVFLRRLPNGGTEAKTIINAPGARRVTLVRRDAAGAATTSEDPADSFDPRTRPWYQGALQQGGVAWTDVYVFFTSRTPGLSVSVPTDWGEPVGAIGLDIDLVALSRFLAGLQVGRHGQAMILDREGRLIAHPDPARVLRDDGGRLRPARLDELGEPVLVRAFDLLRLEGSLRRVEEVGGERHILIANELPEAGRGWRVLITAPEADFTGFVTANNRQVLAMSLLVVGLTALLGLLLARQGLRADRAARQVLQRSREVETQSRAFARLAATAGLFDPESDTAPRALSEALAGATGARRASIWRLLPGGQALRCEDCYDREANGHVAGIELRRAEMPALFRRIMGAEPIVATDAAREPSTAELHRGWMHAFGSVSLISQPVMVGETAVGAVWLEDVPAEVAGAMDFAAAVANMVALRLPGRAQPASARREQENSPSIEAARAGSDQATLLHIPAGDVAAEVLPGVAVLVLHFTDPVILARAGRGGASDTPLAEVIAAMLQDVAAAHGLPYAKLMGEEVVAAAGFTREEAGPPAARRIAAAALDIRDRCHALFEDARMPPGFRIGLDLGVAIGSSVGRGPRFFNLWGDAVRAADHLAASAPIGAIQVSQPLYEALQRSFLFRPRGSFYLPRVGEMRSFILAGQA